MTVNQGVLGSSPRRSADQFQEIGTDFVYRTFASSYKKTLATVDDGSEWHKRNSFSELLFQ